MSQTPPDPIPTLTPSAPESINNLTPSGVTTFPAIIPKLGKCFLVSLIVLENLSMYPFGISKTTVLIALLVF